MQNNPFKRFSGDISLLYHGNHIATNLKLISDDPKVSFDEKPRPSVVVVSIDTFFSRLSAFLLYSFSKKHMHKHMYL